MLGRQEETETEMESKMAVLEKSWHGYCLIDRRKHYPKTDISRAVSPAGDSRGKRFCQRRVR